MVGIVDIDDTVYHIAGIQQFYQFAGAQNSRQTGGRIQPLFIAAGAFGAHSQIPGSDTDRRAEEVGGFKDDGGGILVDTTVLSALDTRYSRRLFAVTDHQHLRGECTLGALQSENAFALSGIADYDLSVLHVLEVKCMEGLAVFQHYIVGDVHNVVDGTHTAGTQTLPQPTGRWADANIFYHLCHIARTEFGVFHPNAEVVLDVITAALYFRLMQPQRYIIGYSSFPGQTGHRQAVGAVGGDFKFHCHVVQTDGLADVGAQRSGSFLALQDKDAVFIGIGEIVNGQPQLCQRAEHTIALLAAQLSLADRYTAGQGGLILGHRDNIAGLDILGAGADLDGGIFAHIDLAHHQVIGIGMGFNREQFAHNNIFDFCSFIGVAFHLGTAHGHVVRELLGSYINVHIIGQPLH